MNVFNGPNHIVLLNQAATLTVLFIFILGSARCTLQHAIYLIIRLLATCCRIQQELTTDKNKDKR